MSMLPFLYIFLFDQMIFHQNIVDCSAEVTKWAAIVSTFENISTSLQTIDTSNAAVETLVSSLQTSTSEILSKTQAHYNDLQSSCSTTTGASTASTTTATTTATTNATTTTDGENPILIPTNGTSTMSSTSVTPIIDPTTNNTTTNSTDTSSSSSSTTPSLTTLSPEDRINSANEIISESNEAYTVAAENANTASSAVDSVDTINSALNTSTTTTSGRVRRQSESTTVSPVNGCSDFSTKYKQLLNELGSFSDSNVDLIKQLVTVLNNTLESIPCDEDEKTSLKSETEGDVEAAKSKANEYKAEKEEEMEELVVRIQEALALIEEANQELIDQNRPTIPGFTASFLLPSTNTASSTPDNSTTTG